MKEEIAAPGSNTEAGDGKAPISALKDQLNQLQERVKNATIEMEMIRAHMNDLKEEAEQVVNIERFWIPNAEQMNEINEFVNLMDKAIKKERRKRKESLRCPRHTMMPQKVEERKILIVLKLRRRGCYISEIAQYVGLGVGTVHGIIKKYNSNPDMQNLIEGGTQMDLDDYLLVHPNDN